MTQDQISKLTFTERINLIKNPNTTPEDLSILKDDVFSDIRYFVALHPNTTPDDLNVLANNHHSEVRKIATERLDKLRIEKPEEIDTKNLQSQIDKLNNTIDRLVEYLEKKEDISQFEKNTNNSSLRSSAEESGEIVHQIVGFTNREKKTIRNVITSTIEQSQFTKFKTLNERTINIHDQHVNWFETIPVKNNK